MQCYWTGNICILVICLKVSMSGNLNSMRDNQLFTHSANIEGRPTLYQALLLRSRGYHTVCVALMEILFSWPLCTYILSSSLHCQRESLTLPTHPSFMCQKDAPGIIFGNSHSNCKETKTCLSNILLKSVCRVN